MAVDIYTPTEVNIIIGGHRVSGWMSVSVEYNEDMYTLLVGTDGLACRSKTTNSSARFTLELLQSSDSNDVLEGFHIADSLAPGGLPIPIMIKDNNGRSLYVADTAWATRRPSASFGKDVGSRTWVFETDNLVGFTGGN